MRPAALINNIILSTEAVPAPIATADPSIDDTTPVVNQTLTGNDGSWTNATSFTRKWRRSGVDISGATNTTYLTTDADFGHTLTYHVTATGAGGVATAESAATGRVAETPAQTIGSELVTTPEFDNWSGDNPVGWTLSAAEDGSNFVTQVAAGGGAGTGAARFVTAAGALVIRQSLLTQGRLYEADVSVSAHTSGTITAGQSGTAWGQFAGVLRRRELYVALLASSNFQIARVSGSVDAVIDFARLREITPNAQLTAPTADMQIDQFYTLPASPVFGDQAWVMLRISSFASGNYWRALLTYTGSNWNVSLQSVEAAFPTTRISATGIGASNGIRIVANGDNWELFTTANSGGLWTSRGTFTSSLYNTATGVNTISSPAFTMGGLHYSDPT